MVWITRVAYNDKTSRGYILPSEQAEVTEVELENQPLGYNGSTQVFQLYNLNRNVSLRINLYCREVQRPGIYYVKQGKIQQLQLRQLS